MVTVPGFLLRRLYVKCSLSNTADGFELELRNGLGSGYAHRMLPLSVDGAELPLADASFVLDGEETPFAEASCEEAGVRHVLYLSSASVYSARPNNPPMLTEDSPPSGLGFITHPWAASTERAGRELGIRPRHTSREAWAAFASVCNSRRE